MPAVAVGLALVLLAGVVAAALRPGTASASTVLHRGDGVVVELADGSTEPLAVGEQVTRGATVRAGRDGAVLRTRGRDTWLGGGTAVTVVDGARQELREGFVMVDARRGPGLSVSTPAAEVSTPSGTVSRIERGELLRVGAYSGEPLQVRAAGRRATTDVARAYQVQVPEGGLPGRTTPLVLTPGDAYERALATALVAADEALRAVAERLDADGRPGTIVQQAVFSDVPSAPALAPGAPRSEQALAYLLARAADDRDLRDRYARVRELRADGGSWGVVALLVDAEVAEVAGLLDVLLAPGSEAVLVAEEVDVTALLGVPGSAPEAPSPAAAAPSGGTGGALTPSDPGPGEGPGTGPGPGPGPGDGEEPGVIETVESTVDTVVDTVLDLLPAQDAGTDQTAVPAGEPSPSPSPSSGGLLGILR